MDYPSEHLLDSIEEIATIKERLSLGDRSLTTARGLHVQKKTFPNSELQYAAGGRLTTKLVFVIGADGVKNVKKYQPGGWEFKAEETLELCRTLERASQALEGWPPEKVQIYQSEEPIDSDLVNRVAEANREHYEENHRQWRLGGLPRWIELRDKFLDELKKEWPIEYVEFRTSHRDAKYTTALLQENIAKVYVTGFMYGRGWISPEELTSATLHLGDVLAVKVRHGLKGARSKGIAFADVLAHIATSGTVDGCSTEEEKSENAGEGEPIDKRKHDQFDATNL